MNTLFRSEKISKPGIGSIKVVPPLTKGTKMIFKKQYAGRAYVQVATEGCVSSKRI